MEKILITGTGRCGTTFLLKIFSFLGFDTGFNYNNYKDYIFGNCNAGMERLYTDDHYILKNPNFLINMEHILNDKTVKIKKVIIPIRNYKDAAKSRMNLGYNNPGGLLGAGNEKDQISFYEHYIANYLMLMTKYNLNTIFLDFDEMIQSKVYLYQKIKSILDEKNISFLQFTLVYNIVSKSSKPNK